MKKVGILFYIIILFTINLFYLLKISVNQLEKEENFQEHISLSSILIEDMYLDLVSPDIKRHFLTQYLEIFNSQSRFIYGEDLISIKSINLDNIRGPLEFTKPLAYEFVKRFNKKYLIFQVEITFILFISCIISLIIYLLNFLYRQYYPLVKNKKL